MGHTDAVCVRMRGIALLFCSRCMLSSRNRHAPLHYDATLTQLAATVALNCSHCAPMCCFWDRVLQAVNTESLCETTVLSLQNVGSALCQVENLSTAGGVRAALKCVAGCSFPWCLGFGPIEKILYFL